MLDLGAEGGKFAIDRRQLLVDFEGHNGGFLFGQDLLAYGIAQGLVQGLLSELGD